MRRALAWIVWALAALGAGVWTGVPALGAAAPGAPALRAPALGAAAAPDANLVAARAAAQRILSMTPVPPGAVPASADRSLDGSLGQLYHARGADQVIRTRYWTVGEAAAGVNAYIYHHPPGGSRFDSGVGPPSTASSDWQEQRTFPGQTGSLTSELLEITTAPARGGATEIRADAIVLWRPTWERIPASARAARVRLDGFAQRTVSGAGLARLRALVDTSPVVAPGVYSCPAGVPGQAIRVAFVDARGRILAHIGADSATGCVWLSVTVGTRRGPALQDGWDLASRLWAAGSLVHCSAAQLAVGVSAPSVYPSGATAMIRARNVAPAPCSLKGAPSIVLRTAAGRRLPVSDHAAGGTPGVVTAPGHAGLSADLSWSDRRAGRCALPPPASALVGVPGIRQGFLVTLTPSRHRLGPCRGRVTVSGLGWD
jgi:hypothetical protein